MIAATPILLKARPTPAQLRDRLAAPRTAGRWVAHEPWRVREPKDVPLSLVTRLEEVDCRKIELSNGRHVVQYRGQLMPLVRVDDETRFRNEGAQPLLVFSDEGRSMGLAVDEIVDIVEDRLEIEVSSERPGVLGSAVIKGQATEVLDVGHFLPIAFDDWFGRKDKRMSASRSVLLVDDSAFFRNMLQPVLRAAGFSRPVPVAGLSCVRPA